MISNIQWENILSNKNVDVQRYVFIHKSNLLRGQLFPRNGVNFNPNLQVMFWMNIDALTKVKEEHNLRKIYMLSRKKILRKYCIARSQAKCCIARNQENIVLHVTKPNVALHVTKPNVVLHVTKPNVVLHVAKPNVV